MSIGFDDAPPAALIDALARTSFEVMGRLARIAAEEDMSLTQLRMLAILRDREPRMAELAAALGTDRSSASGLIARAEARGLVVRARVADDKRGFTVALSREGQDFARRLEGRTVEALAPLFEHLTGAARRNLAASLLSLLER